MKKKFLFLTLFILLSSHYAFTKEDIWLSTPSDELIEVRAFYAVKKNPVITYGKEEKNEHKIPIPKIIYPIKIEYLDKTASIRIPLESDEPDLLNLEKVKIIVGKKSALIKKPTHSAYVILVDKDNVIRILQFAR